MKQEIKNEILNGRITDNASGMKFTLKNGCLPKLFVEVVKELIQENSIKIDGEFNSTATKIHAIRPGDKLYYKIRTI